MQPRHEHEANHDKFIISMADEEERHIFLTLLKDSAKEIPLVLDQVDRDFEKSLVSVNVMGDGGSISETTWSKGLVNIPLTISKKNV